MIDTMVEKAVRMTLEAEAANPLAMEAEAEGIVREVSYVLSS